LISAHSLKNDPNDPKFSAPSLWDRTIIGQRRSLPDPLRLQVYGAPWAITRIDQRYPRFYEPRMENFGTDVTWQGFNPPSLKVNDLGFDVLRAGLGLAGNTPVIIVNEPIFISHGVNSHLRYDFFYPRWAYDAYRDLMTGQASAQGWRYIDLWDVISSDLFTDSAVHVTPVGSRQLAERVGTAMLDLIGEQKR
jgi:hypothetical protein